jgi:glutathione S-transferase
LPAPPAGSAPALRYLLDRVNVPRDMSLHAARHLRHFLERTARAADAIGAKSSASASVSGGTRERVVPIPLRHRRDQDPHAFIVAKKEKSVAGDQKCVSA